MKFHTPHRLKDFDYASFGSYMITFNTGTKEIVLSDIVPQELAQPEVCLTPFGFVTEKYILRIPEVYSGVILDNYVIMPDHLHLLIKLAEVEKAVSLALTTEELPSTSVTVRVPSLFFTAVKPRASARLSSVLYSLTRLIPVDTL